MNDKRVSFKVKNKRNQVKTPKCDVFDDIDDELPDEVINHQLSLIKQPPEPTPPELFKIEPQNETKPNTFNENVLEISQCVNDNKDASENEAMVIEPDESHDEHARTLDCPDELPLDFLLISGSKQEQMFAEIVRQKNVYYKHQQRGERDLSVPERVQILREIFDKNKTLFVERFGKYLSLDSLEFFKNVNSDDYMMKFHLDQCLRYHDKSKRREKELKNRRMGAMRQMMVETSYFNEEEMMRRNPLLYDQLIGQYLSEDERRQLNAATTDTNSLSLVNLLLDGVERDQVEQLKAKQQDMEDVQIDSKISDEPGRSQTHWGEWSLKTDRRNDEIADCSRKFSIRNYNQVLVDDKEKALMRDEFFDYMYHSFLTGQDDFDYSNVDMNDNYDPIDIREHDEQEKYFDSD